MGGKIGWGTGGAILSCKRRRRRPPTVMLTSASQPSWLRQSAYEHEMLAAALPALMNTSAHDPSESGRPHTFVRFAAAPPPPLVRHAPPFVSSPVAAS